MLRAELDNEACAGDLGILLCSDFCILDLQAGRLSGAAGFIQAGYVTLRRGVMRRIGPLGDIRRQMREFLFHARHYNLFFSAGLCFSKRFLLSSVL